MHGELVGYRNLKLQHGQCNLSPIIVRYQNEMIKKFFRLSDSKLRFGGTGVFAKQHIQRTGNPMNNMQFFCSGIINKGNNPPYNAYCLQESSRTYLVPDSSSWWAMMNEWIWGDSERERSEANHCQFVGGVQQKAGLLRIVRKILLNYNVEKYVVKVTWIWIMNIVTYTSMIFVVGSLVNMKTEKLSF